MNSIQISPPPIPRGAPAIKAGGGTRARATGPVATSFRILVVEDQAVIAKLLAEVLEEMGHDVCAIEATERGAVAAARRCRPDLMIVDARLGEGSGLFAVAEILRTGFVPHIFVSGDANRVQALRPEAVVLQKPFRESELARAILRAMDPRTPH